MGYQITDFIDWTSKGPGVASVLPQFGLSLSDLATFRVIARWEHDEKRGRVTDGEVAELSPEGLEAWCRASQEHLAFDCGVDRSTIARSIKKLVKGGFIEERNGAQRDDPKFRRTIPAKLSAMLERVEPALAEWNAAQTKKAAQKVAKWAARIAALDATR